MKDSVSTSVLAILFSIIFLSCEKDKVTDNPFIPTPTILRTQADLSQRLSEIRENSEVPGFALTVVKNNKVLFQESFGYADIENGYPYTNQTTQAIGSISKTFIAAALVKAMEDGHFTLETNINDILPVRIANPNHPHSEIKVKHLVTHTSGLLDNLEAYSQAYHILPGEDLSSPGSQLLLNEFGITQREKIPLGEFLFEYYLRSGDYYDTLNFSTEETGTAWNYSNIASSLAAYLIEYSTGTPFDDYVKTNVFQPLGMHQTAYKVADLKSSGLAKLYWDKKIALPYYANDSYPDGSVITCNEDLAKYLMEMMNGAKGNTSTLFSENGYEMLFKARLENGVMSPEHGDNQAMFWLLEDGKIRHDGSDPGTTCNLQFDRDGETGYFLLTNSDASTDNHTLLYFLFAGKVEAAVEEFLANN
jgi:CubicO group peptidase (beta-lactamase class C family)